MAIKLRTKRLDPILKQIAEALRKYGAEHPTAQIEVYRQNPVSIRVRVVDPQFEGLSRAAREDDLWRTFERLPEDVVSEVSVLLLLTPTEAKKSFANFDFDHPIPSQL